MKFPVIGIVVFAVTFGAASLWRRQTGPDDSKKGTGNNQGLEIAGREKPGETLLAAVHALLRAGDLKGAKRLLADAAAHDPKGFFVVLSHLPHIDGLDDLIKLAAPALEWDLPEVTRLLNGIPAPGWRDMAWEAYAGARVGKVPDEEAYKVGIKANRYSWVAGIETLLTDAAEKRPVEFMALLNRMGGTSVREAFCGILMKDHPELAGELFRSIPDGSAGANYDRSYFLQAQVMGLPTAENLKAAISEAGPSSVQTAQLLTGWTYPGAAPEERQAIREFIAEQPDNLRQALTGAALFSGDPAAPFEEFNALLGMSDSGLQQRDALESWLKKQPNLDPAERDWVDQLPTEKLKAKANEILDSRAAAKR